MLDYTLVAGLLLYLLIVKIMATSNIRPITASSVVVLGYFALSSVVRGIVYLGYDISLWQLFGLVPVVTLLLQFAVALLSFTKLSNSEESYSNWIFWGVVGCIGIFFLAPYVATILFARF